MSLFGPNSKRRSYPSLPSASPSVASLLAPSQYNTPFTKRSSSNSSLAYGDSPYSSLVSAGHNSVTTISEKFSLSPDPTAWGSNISPEVAEADDSLHNPDPRRDRTNDHGLAGIFSTRGLANLGCLALLCTGIVALFAGYPVISHFTSRTQSTLGGFNIGGINATGQIPTLAGNFGLIDKDTDPKLYTKPSYKDPSIELQLVFSDEFNQEGRTFYPGDDPYWEAADLHYWQTNNLEWYDPAAITTKGGALEVTLSQKDTHGLRYEGGMMSTWNKFCFTGGLLETSVTLPGFNNVAGLWPAVWTLGNLGRAGYGASLDGMWPYTYDACDIGTVKNQTLNGLPLAATTTGNPYDGGVLSYLPGQKLSRCTCKGESHPGPVHSDGTYVGRAAPEIDVFEAQNKPHLDRAIAGQVSQSAQWAPYNAGYEWFNTTDNLVIPDLDQSFFNSYLGAVYQQATSVVTYTDQKCYEMGTDATKCFSTYGFEYKPGFDNAYITWVSDSKVSWTLNVAGMGADSRTEISARPIPLEPMYLIVNLGMSENFGTVDVDHLVFPTTMRVDWIRVYQPKDGVNVGCDPKGFPTSAYIDKYIEAYTNPNLTTWVNDYNQPWPKNKLVDQC
ncbi:glycoside hydrolase family 16 protein [Crepidotus variabilis]|uniref:Glycoside hydrolase family 16 protein n=1 Tax=Crepidotus variabilis TaxID=179855 RepID=A0A9P6JPP5_9AGAR|nr:glycoside hydrolase family 16 protein [Crepidotus variabilis]